ncbi:TFIIS central domain-containing protein [Balamuthia mandrillaris]
MNGRSAASRPALKIGSLEELARVTHFNGLSVEHIERRAMPLEDKTEDPEEAPFRSHMGFLGPGEKLLQVMEDDWQTVLHSLHTTHLELAYHIKALILASENVKHTAELLYDLPKSYKAALQRYFTSSPKLMPPKKSSLRQLRGQPQPLRVTKDFFLGYQYSLFYNNNKREAAQAKSSTNKKEKTKKDKPDTKDEEEADDEAQWKWCVEYKFKNLNNGLKVCIGGDATAGVVRYIQNYGFYEGGGPSNAYRVDPSVLVAVLTGQRNEGALRWAEERAQLKLTRLQREKEAWEEEYTKRKEKRLKEEEEGEEDQQDHKRKQSQPEEEELACLLGQVQLQTQRLAAKRLKYAAFLGKLQENSAL